MALKDQFDVDLEDHDLLGEIELLTELILTAKRFDHHLSVAEIDAAIGLGSDGGAGAGPTTSGVHPSEGEHQR